MTRHILLYFSSVNGKVYICKIHKFYYDIPSTNKTIPVRTSHSHSFVCGWNIVIKFTYLTDIYLAINWWKIQQNMPGHFLEIPVFLGGCYAAPCRLHIALQMYYLLFFLSCSLAHQIGLISWLSDNTVLCTWFLTVYRGLNFKLCMRWACGMGRCLSIFIDFLYFSEKIDFYSK